MVDTRSAQIIEMPDLPPRGSTGPRGRQALLGPELGTAFDQGDRLFGSFSGGDVFDYGLTRFLDRP